MFEFVIGYITTKEEKEAERIAKALLSKNLIACANIIPTIKSFFWWKKKIDEANETILIIKTRSSLKRKIIEEVKKLHSYEVPCIIFFPIVSGNQEFLEWIEKNTEQSKEV
jgi:periplasmic divalent cation tolerance protein